MRILLFILMSLSCYAFNVPDTVIAVVGEKAEFEIVLDDYRGGLTIEGELYLKNPSMFYPEEFKKTDNSPLDFEIILQNDSIYNFKIEIAEENIDMIILSGEMLAGNDSVSFVYFNDIRYDDIDIGTQISLLKANTTFNPMLYVKLTKIKSIYPNPLFGTKTLNVVFEIHLDSYVEFVISDHLGRIIKTVEYDFIEKGTHEIEIDLSIVEASSLMYISLLTDGFNDFGRFVLIQ